MSQEENLGTEPQDKGDEERRHPLTYWPKLNTPEWVSALATVVAALAALAAVVVSIQTRYILQGQLDQMASGSAATERLIELQAQLNGTAGFQEAQTDRLRKATENFASAMNTEAKNSGKLADATTGQLREMQAEQSPLISVDSPALVNPYPFFDAAQGGRLAWNIPYTNIGKNTAFLHSDKIYMKVAKAPFRCVNCGPFKTIRINTGQHEFTTGFWPMTKAEFDATMKLDEGIIILVFFDYRDSAGHKYTSDICLGHYSNGAYEACSGAYRERDMK